MFCLWKTHSLECNLFDLEFDIIFVRVHTLLIRHANLFSKHFETLKLTVVLRRLNYLIMLFNCNDESMPVQSRSMGNILLWGKKRCCFQQNLLCVLVWQIIELLGFHRMLINYYAALIRTILKFFLPCCSSDLIEIWKYQEWKYSPTTKFLNWILFHITFWIYIQECIHFAGE